MTNITNFDPATGRTATKLVTAHDRGSWEYNCRVGGGADCGTVDEGGSFDESFDGPAGPLDTVNPNYVAWGYPMPRQDGSGTVVSGSDGFCYAQHTGAVSGPQWAELDVNLQAVTVDQIAELYVLSANDWSTWVAARLFASGGVEFKVDFYGDIVGAGTDESVVALSPGVHTLRIEVDGVETGAAVRSYVDSQLKMSSTLSGPAAGFGGFGVASQGKILAHRSGSL